MRVFQAAQFTLFTLLLASSPAYADMVFNLTEGVTPISHDIYNLHMTIFWVCVGIGAVVFSVMIHSIIYHRKAVGAKAAHFHEHFWLEITWTIIPFLILVAMAIPATRVLFNMHDVDKADITIKVTGSQWKWHYDYLEDGFGFYSDNSTPYNQMHGSAPKDEFYLREVDHPLVLPIHKKIRFVITSTDVIHGWWVPELGVKHDAIPGFIYETWARINRPGIYRGQCSKLCGLNHGFMPIVVIAMSETDYSNWVTTQKGGVVNPATATTPAPAAATAAPAPTPAAAPAPTEKKAKTPATTEKTTTQKPTKKSAKTPPGKTPTPVAAATTATTPAPAAATTPAAKAMTRDELMKQGEQVFLGTCAACHKPDGTGSPPVFPALKGSKTVTGPVAGHINTVMNGRPGTAMQAFKDQFNDVDIASVITYERNSFGNNMGDMVQPGDIAAARAKGNP